ncbi:HTH domain-containing protein [Streptomyces sp. NPDC087659]|uniref:HTH domain-containing protein n=1 Tax=Streptomyces sp. NPDC087659 TaxID=3365801 RepID=UPI00380636DC
MSQTAPPNGELSRDARRTLVRQLADQDMSARAIALKIGVSKDTVRRDLDALRQDAAPVAQTDAPPAPAPAPPAQVGAPGGARLELDLDDQLRRDLATIARTGVPAPDAIRFAVAFVAHGYRWLWSTGRYPEGSAPPRMAIRIPDPPTPIRRTEDPTP